MKEKTTVGMQGEVEVEKKTIVGMEGGGGGGEVKGGRGWRWG